MINIKLSTLTGLLCGSAIIGAIFVADTWLAVEDHREHAEIDRSFDRINKQVDEMRRQVRGMAQR